jgi:hypothetical protein
MQFRERTVGINSKDQIFVKESDLDDIGLKLTQDMYSIDHLEQPVMTNSIVACCFLYSQEKEMTFGKVKTITQNLHRYLEANNCKSYVSGPPQNKTILHIAKNLGLSVSGKPIDNN